MKKHAILACLLAACAGLFAGCGPSDDSKQASSLAQPPAGTAVVFGTVFDLRTGEPVADVEVSLPGDRSTRTDHAGRFQVVGVPVGTQGKVRARASDGREAQNPLLPLGNERREIVMHLPK